MKKYSMKQLGFISLVLLPTLAVANFPRGCEQMGHQFKDNDLVINDAGSQTLFLVNNISRSQIELKRRQDEDAFMSPSLSAKLLAGRWGAFASDVKSLHFQCYKVFKGDKALVDCQSVLAVCQYPRVKFALSNMGNYWVSSNKSIRNTLRDAKKKGISLRW